MRVIHKKTGKTYVVIDKAIDCSNERDGLPVIVYSDGAQVFVRDAAEFFRKFARPEPLIHAEWPDALEDAA